MSKTAGFTLLEIMLVLLILGATAGLIVATLPERDNQPLAEKLLNALHWSAEQAETEGQAYRLELRTHGWQLFRLEKEETGATTFLPGYQWRMLSSGPGRQQLPEKTQLQVYDRTRAVTLPTDLFFLPDGSVSSLTMEIVTERGTTQRIDWCEGQYKLGEVR